MTLFNLKHGQVPSLNTIRRTLAESIVAEELQKVVGYHLHDRYGGDESKQIVLDGKTMRYSTSLVTYQILTQSYRTADQHGDLLRK